MQMLRQRVHELEQNTEFRPPCIEDLLESCRSHPIPPPQPQRNIFPQPHQESPLPCHPSWQNLDSIRPPQSYLQGAPPVWEDASARDNKLEAAEAMYSDRAERPSWGPLPLTVPMEAEACSMPAVALWPQGE